MHTYPSTKTRCHRCWVLFKNYVADKDGIQLMWKLVHQSFWKLIILIIRTLKIIKMCRAQQIISLYGNWLKLTPATRCYTFLHLLMMYLNSCFSSSFSPEKKTLLFLIRRAAFMSGITHNLQWVRLLMVSHVTCKERSSLSTQCCPLVHQRPLMTRCGHPSFAQAAPVAPRCNPAAGQWGLPLTLNLCCTWVLAGVSF